MDCGASQVNVHCCSSVCASLESSSGTRLHVLCAQSLSCVLHVTDMAFHDGDDVVCEKKKKAPCPALLAATIS